MKPVHLPRIQSEGGASAVLSLQHDACLAYWGIDYAAMLRKAAGLGLRMERCQIRDFDVADMRRRLPVAVSLLADMIARGHRVYVHCTAGMGRAPLVVLGYLVLAEGVPTDRAIRHIRAVRPEAVPSLEALEGCREDLTHQHRQAIQSRAYDLYEMRGNSDPEADWDRAQADILRRVLIRQEE